MEDFGYRKNFEKKPIKEKLIFYGKISLILSSFLLISYITFEGYQKFGSKNSGEVETIKAQIEPIKIFPNEKENIANNADQEHLVYEDIFGKNKEELNRDRANIINIPEAAIPKSELDKLSQNQILLDNIIDPPSDSLPDEKLNNNENTIIASNNKDNNIAKNINKNSDKTENNSLNNNIKEKLILDTKQQQDLSHNDIKNNSKIIVYDGKKNIVGSIKGNDFKEDNGIDKQNINKNNSANNDTNLKPAESLLTSVKNNQNGKKSILINNNKIIEQNTQTKSTKANISSAKIDQNQINNKIDDKKSINKRKVIRIQLAAMSSQKAAENLWQELNKDHQKLFNNLKPNIEEVNMGKRGTFYRLQAGNFFNQIEAEEFCKKYIAKQQKKNADCLIVE